MSTKTNRRVPDPGAPVGSEISRSIGERYIHDKHGNVFARCDFVIDEDTGEAVRRTPEDNQ